MPVLIVCAMLTLASHASAQSIPDSIAGHRARITLQVVDPVVEGYGAPQSLRGAVLSVGADSLVIRLHQAVAPTSIAKSGITRVEMSRGVNQIWSALKKGSEMGLSAGFYGATLRPFDTSMVRGGVVMGGLGFLLGATIGAFFPEERWVTVFKQENPSAKPGQLSK